MNKDLDSLVRSILEKGHLMSLATVDEDGPWAADLIYVFDNALNIYWLSMPDMRHSQALLQNPKVAATITISTRSKEPNEGLQIAGTAEKIEGDILGMATKHLAKRNHPPPEREGQLLEKGRSWYKLTPTKIRVIYEPAFGMEARDYLPLWAE